MLIPNRSNQRRAQNLLLSIGLVFLVVAVLSQTLLLGSDHSAGSWIHFLIGMCYGFSITCLLGGLAQSRRRKCDAENTQTGVRT